MGCPYRKSPSISMVAQPANGVFPPAGTVTAQYQMWNNLNTLAFVQQQTLATRLNGWLAALLPGPCSSIELWINVVTCCRAAVDRHRTWLHAERMKIVIDVLALAHHWPLRRRIRSSTSLRWLMVPILYHQSISRFSENGSGCPARPTLSGPWSGSST
jgi:hypothetical protein